MTLTLKHLRSAFVLACLVVPFVYGCATKNQPAAATNAAQTALNGMAETIGDSDSHADKIIALTEAEKAEKIAKARR
jgi:hypothetical protein